MRNLLRFDPDLGTPGVAIAPGRVENQASAVSESGRASPSHPQKNQPGAPVFGPGAESGGLDCGCRVQSESGAGCSGAIMNDWKAPIGGGGGGGKRNYTGPNGSAEKVDYSQLPLGGGGGSDDEAGGDDWIQRQIRGHKVSSILMRSHRVVKRIVIEGC